MVGSLLWMPPKEPKPKEITPLVKVSWLWFPANRLITTEGERLSNFPGETIRAHSPELLSWPVGTNTSSWLKHKHTQDVQFPSLEAHPSSKDRFPRGVVYHCYQKYLGLFTVSLQQKMCWQGLSQKWPELVLGKPPVALESGLQRAQDFTKSPLRGNQDTYKVKVPEEQQSHKGKKKKTKKKVGSLQRELRIALLYF